MPGSHEGLHHHDLRKKKKKTTKKPNNKKTNKQIKKSLCLKYSILIIINYAKLKAVLADNDQ